MQIKDLNIFRLEVFGKILIGRGENMLETALLKPDNVEPKESFELLENF